ncbi:MAG: hypothetical protein ABIR33_14195 [Pyrinomonadaceae bacterium]
MDAEKSTTFKNPKRTKLNIACVYLTNYFKGDDQGEVAQAQTILDSHNLQLEVWPQGGIKYSGNTLEYPEPVPHDSYDDAVNRESYKALVVSARSLIASKVTFSTYLTVVFGQFKHPGIGITPQGMPITTPLCIISPNANLDKMDLIHEMGHAADVHHENSLAKNFMNQASGRSEMMKFQIEKMARSWYAVG